MEAYAQIASAFASLDRPTAALDLLAQNFVTGVQTCLCQIAERHCAKSSSGGGADGKGGKGPAARVFHSTPNFRAQFKVLCAQLAQVDYEACLADLCSSMCHFMLSYNAISDWHAAQDAAAEDPSAGDEASASSASAAAPDRISPAEYRRMRLQNGRRRLWLEIQREVTAFFNALHLSDLDLPTFLSLLGHIRRLINIGEDFSASGSTTLDETIHAKSFNYFQGFHRNTLDQLRSLLCADRWEARPIAKSFNIFELKDFAFLRRRNAAAAAAAAANKTPAVSSPAAAPASPLPASSASSNVELEGYASTLAAFSARPDMFYVAASATRQRLSSHSANPLALGTAAAAAQIDEDEEILNPETAPPPPPLPPGRTRPPPPHCSNTAIFVVRCFARYLHMMEVLKPIATEVFVALTQVFDYYLWTVQSKLASDLTTYPTSVLTGKGRALLGRLEDMELASTLAIGSAGTNGASSAGGAAASGANSSDGAANGANAATGAGAAGAAAGAPASSISAPSHDAAGPSGATSSDAVWPPPVMLHPDIDLQAAPSIYGLAERITGFESLQFLVTVIRSIHQHLTRRLPPESHGRLRQYFAEVRGGL